MPALSHFDCGLPFSTASIQPRSFCGPISASTRSRSCHRIPVEAALWWCRKCYGKTFPQYIKIAILHCFLHRLAKTFSDKTLFCHSHGENEPVWCNIAGIPCYMVKKGTRKDAFYTEKRIGNMLLPLPLMLLIIGAGLGCCGLAVFKKPGRFLLALGGGALVIEFATGSRPPAASHRNTYPTWNNSQKVDYIVVLGGVIPGTRSGHQARI